MVSEWPGSLSLPTGQWSLGVLLFQRSGFTQNVRGGWLGMADWAASERGSG